MPVPLDELANERAVGRGRPLPFPPGAQPEVERPKAEQGHRRGAEIDDVLGQSLVVERVEKEDAHE